MGKVVVAAKSVASPPDDGPPVARPSTTGEFTIVIDRTTGGTLGIDVEGYTGIIAGIKPGLIQSWNHDHEETLTVRKGYQLVEVNGFRGVVSRMIHECQRPQ